MPIKKAPEAMVTKTGETVLTNYCRKCMKELPAKEFYECVDTGFIDSNGLMSVCKNCIQSIYDSIFDETQSIEKTIHKICISLNIRFSNEAVSATKTHINTLLESGKNVNALFSIYKMKLTAMKKSMDKSGLEDMTYDDIGTIYTSEIINTKEIPIPEDVRVFWGNDVTRLDIEFLETQYANFKQTHKADTYAEIVLLKEVCYTMLNIKKLRVNNDDTQKAVKELQDLMKNLAISPNVANMNSANKGMDTFGLWIQDIEREEPAQWLKSDPRGDIYRDVANTDEYFKKYVSRPTKNLITGNKDFGTDESDSEEFEFDEDANFALIDDGETED